MDAVVVVTCPTRPQYLAATLAGLDAAGADECRRLVCSDGPWTEPCAWPVTSKSDGPSGTRNGMWFAYRKALETGADRVLYCEDDLIVSADAVRKIRAFDVPDDVAFLNFFDHKPEVRRSGPALVRVPAMGFDGRGLWGSLCVLFPRRTLEYLVQHGPDEWPHPFRKTKNAGDCIMSWALARSPWPEYLMHVPSLVDHAGDESATGHQRIRRAPNYIDGPRPVPQVCAVCRRDIADDIPGEIVTVPGARACRSHVVPVARTQVF